MRQPLVIGNWKLNGSRHIAQELIITLRNELEAVNYCNIAIAPPTIYLDQVAHALSGSHIKLSAQNVDIHTSGAFTGETSVDMLKDIGVKYIIIGHSERRIYHQEKDSVIAKKFLMIKKIGLIPVICIGETKEERVAGKTHEVCIRQLDSILKTIDTSKMLEDIILAYEPVWAIGTGISATPNQAQSMHKFIRNYIAKYNNKTAEKIIIQYGGSVNAVNASELFIQPDIDGALVGGASLQANTFSAIVKATNKK
ncbi:triose-phosphate isomerase [Candidatus Profftia sp. (ex Adelges kitamiensis)]|uniref:triose-phosphate isomerase n=1 Tax=Candidatus Profftia sp. (ex Adelges kitamiensis) TaxID=2864218 RepID=UPI001CE2E1FC|nr:triose-phosphate isomerase [Candidatus Profftia sp. (ex Adelges kitamiensis)]